MQAGVAMLDAVPAPAAQRRCGRPEVENWLR